MDTVSIIPKIQILVYKEKLLSGVQKRCTHFYHVRHFKCKIYQINCSFYNAIRFPVFLYWTSFFTTYMKPGGWENHW